MNPNLKKPNTVTVKTYWSDREKLNQLCRELSVVQQKNVRTPELIKRALNIPELKKLLVMDAEMKRRMKI